MGKSTYSTNKLPYPLQQLYYFYSSPILVHSNVNASHHLTFTAPFKLNLTFKWWVEIIVKCVLWWKFRLCLLILIVISKLYNWLSFEEQDNNGQKKKKELQIIFVPQKVFFWVNYSFNSNSPPVLGYMLKENQNVLVWWSDWQWHY